MRYAVPVGCGGGHNHGMHLAYTPEANTLLADAPLALLIGMLLDQQIPMEKAFTSPYELRQRLGGKLDAATIAGYDPEAFEALFRTPPALHRFPKAMARRVQELAGIIADDYGGDASAIWSDVSSGDELVARLAKLPGFGAQKAAILTALLGKQFGVQPPGWRDAAGTYGEDGVHRSVADVVDDASLTKVRSYKQQIKAAAKAK
jgi:uncharacterized HhH-GPD family protein